MKIKATACCVNRAGSRGANQFSFFELTNLIQTNQPGILFLILTKRFGSEITHRQFTLSNS